MRLFFLFLCLILPLNLFAKEEVLQLVIFGWNENTQSLELKSLGSGTIVQKNIILTNKHVVQIGKNKSADFILLCKGTHKESVRVKCDIPAGVSAVHEKADVAIVKPIKSPFLLPVKTSTTKRVYLERVKMIGFPTPQGLNGFGDTETLNSVKKWLGEENIPLEIKGDHQTITRGEIISKIKETNSGQIYYKTNAVVNFGNSGGGAFDQTGSYIGIPTLKDSNGNAFFLAFADINNWFKNNLGKKVEYSDEALDFYEDKISKTKKNSRKKISKTRKRWGGRRNLKGLSSLRSVSKKNLSKLNLKKAKRFSFRKKRTKNSNQKKYSIAISRYKNRSKNKTYKFKTQKKVLSVKKTLRERLLEKLRPNKK